MLEFITRAIVVVLTLAVIIGSSIYQFMKETFKYRFGKGIKIVLWLAGIIDIIVIIVASVLHIW